MGQGCRGLPLLINFLLLSNAYGFRDGAYSNAHHHWGQPSGYMFSPRAVQSSVSEVPVSGNLPKEVGSSLFADRPLKRLSLFQFVKGHVSSWPESTSHAQTAPSSSVLASLPLPLNEQQAGSLTSLQGSSGSTITDTASVSTQGASTSFPAVLGTSGLSTSNQSSPSLYMSSSQEASGAKSAQATLPVFSQESISNSSSSAAGVSSLSQGSPGPLSEGSAQSISSQGQSSLSQSQGALSPYSPDSYNKLSSSVSSQSTSDQSTPSVYGSSSQGSSGSLLGASGSSIQVDLSPQSQESNQLLPSPLEVSSPSTNSQDSQSNGPASPLETQGSLSLTLSTQTPGSASKSQCSSGPELSGSSYSQPTSSSGARFGASTGFASQEVSSTSSGSVQPQGTTSQFVPGLPSSYSSVSLSSPQGADNQSAAVQSSRKQFTSSYGSQSGSSKLLNLQGSTNYGGSPKPQGTTSQFSPGSPSSLSATVQSSQKLSSSSYRTLTGSSPLFRHGGSLQPQATASQFAPTSLSSYNCHCVSLFSPQDIASVSASVQTSQNQFTSTFTGSTGTLSSSSTPLNLQGSITYGGSLQPQATASQFSPASPSYNCHCVSLSLPQGVASQSSQAYQSYSGSQNQKSHRWQPSQSFQTSNEAASPVPSQMQSRLSSLSSAGDSSGDPRPFVSAQGVSTSYGGSLQPQVTTSQFAPGSLSSYPSASLSSSQGTAVQSATVQSSQKLFTSSYGTQSGSSRLLNLQGITTYRGSLQPQGSTSLFSTGSPSLSATVQSSQKQFTSRYGTQSGGSLQPQGTTSQFAPGSPSTSSATVQSSRKQFTSSYGTQSGSTILTLQEGTTYGGSLQPQGTTSLFAPGSPSSYPSVSLSSPQGFASQKFQSYAVAQNQKSQSWPPSESSQTSGVALSQGASSVSELLSSSGLPFNQNTPPSKPSHSFSSNRYYVKG